MKILYSIFIYICILIVPYIIGIGAVYICSGTITFNLLVWFAGIITLLTISAAIGTIFCIYTLIGGK